MNTNWNYDQALQEIDNLDKLSDLILKDNRVPMDVKIEFVKITTHRMFTITKDVKGEQNNG